MFLKIWLLSGEWIIGARVQAGREARSVSDRQPLAAVETAESLMQVWFRFRMRASRPCRQCMWLRLRGRNGDDRAAGRGWWCPVADSSPFISCHKPRLPSAEATGSCSFMDSHRRYF